MTVKEIIDGLKFTIDMFLFDPTTGETFTETRNDMDKTTVDACKGAIELLEQTQWIPCSERLPEHGGRYLISVLDGINRRTTVAPYLPRCKAWTMTGRMAYWKVIAWMPLPEPAKEDDYETD